jgi:hypothetical protein
MRLRRSGGSVLAAERALDRPRIAVMNPRKRLVLLLTAPVFGLVVVVVRAAWLAYLRTLSLTELHMRIFDHSTAIALGVWGLCVVLTALIMWAVSSRFARPQVKDDSKTV